MIEREVMDYDVVIIGAGPAGLTAACRLKQQAKEQGTEVSVCVVEKAAAIGAHSLSGAVFNTRALDELFPDWQASGAPLHTPVVEDKCYYLRNDRTFFTIPSFCLPNTMKNAGNYIISLGELCLWLAQQAEEFGVEIYPGTTAADIYFEEDGRVGGIITGDFGRDKQGEPKPGVFTPGMILKGKFTLFAEGCRGHLGKQLLQRFQLDRNVDVQHYAIGLKELWQIDAALHQPGLVIHATGWPLDNHNPGGAFLYHLDNQRIAVGLIVDLSYRNPHLSPFDEFQRLKLHPAFKPFFVGGQRLGYGARALCKGGINSLPEMIFPGGALIGCELGTLNFSKIKGNHTAMKSAMLAADAVITALKNNDLTLDEYPESFKTSWLYQELFQSRNFGAAIHKFGMLLGGAFNTFEQNIVKAKWAVTLHERIPDYQKLHQASKERIIQYPKPDGKITFDKLSSVFLSGTNHAEDQPVHLLLTDPTIPVNVNLAKYDEPAQRYCPAGVYEIVTHGTATASFQINAQNCIHCKTCDIKDPAQNITWRPPEGGGGPNYVDM